MIKKIIWLLVIDLIHLISAFQYRYDYEYSGQAVGWFKFHRVPANWHEARLRCKFEGANLASPVDTAIANMMKTITANITSCMYTGIHATLSKGDYQTIEGEALGRIPITWAPNEPDNFEDKESCLILNNNGDLADVGCQETFPYMCFRKKTNNMFVNGCGTFDNEYILEPKTGSCYKFHRYATTWSRASMACTAEGGYLAIINSAVESQVIKDIFARHPANGLIQTKIKDYAYVGFSNWDQRGLWWTVHGETLQEAGFETFSNGQPDSSDNGEYCGSVHRNGLYNDISCSSIAVFICEKSPESLLTRF